MTESGSATEEVRESPVTPDGLKEAARGPARGKTPPRVQDAYRVELPAFEGPLDLLLHLIQQHELDILDIPIAFVTEKYLGYLRLMEEMNIDVASDYLVMAAQLAHIKSRTLVPAAPVDEDDEGLLEEEDPRAELVRRLLEYQKYKDAASALGGRSVLGRDVFTRGAPSPEGSGPAPLSPVGVFRLLEAFQGVLQRAEITTDHEIGVEQFTIADRIQQLSARLTNAQSVRFEALFEGERTRGELVLTFLALLEMTRLRMITLNQNEPFESITVALSSAHSEAPEDESGSAEPIENAQDEAQHDG